MSAVSNDSGGGLYTLVEAQRGMSPTEIFNFLTTGEVPDLSQPPSEDADSDESELFTPTDEDVMALLSGTSVTASASLFSQQSHHNDLINDEVTYHDDDVVAAGKKRKWKAEQHPRDRRGRFIEKGAVVDLLSAKKPTIQHLLSAVKELDQDRWNKLTDAQQEHITENVDKIPSGAGPATTSMKEKLAKLTSTTTPTTTTTSKKVMGQDALDSIPAKYDYDEIADFWTGPWFDSAFTHEALDAYTGNGYKKINDGLRNGEGDLTGLSVSDRRHVEQLDKLLARDTVKQEISVFRGVKNGDVVFGDAWNDDLTGAEWREFGFLSTSANQAVADKFTVGDKSARLNITVPAGTRALALSGFDDEGEILVNRGHTLRIVADRGVVNGRRELDVEVIPHGEEKSGSAEADTDQDIPGTIDDGLPGKDQETQADTNSVASGKSVTPAIIYKKHADGAVIAESLDGTQRMRWDATRKKFVVESRDTAGSWSETDQLTKTNAYADVKTPGKWFEPGTAKIEDQIIPVSSSQTSENALPDSQPTGKTDPAGSQVKPTKKLTADERAALKTWSGPGYKKISNALRAGETTPDVSLIDSAIAKNTLPEMTLYRSLVTTPDFNPSDVLKAGTVFTDANFLATSSKHPSGTLFENYHSVTIKVPNGANGVKVSGPYNEVLLPRNSKLFIDKVDQNRTVPGTTAPIYDFYATLVVDDDIKPDVDVNVVDGVSPDSYLIDKTDTAKSQVKPYSYVTGNDVEDVAGQNIDDWQRVMYDTGGTGEDAILKKIAETQGWDKLPRVGTKEELDAAIAAGGTVSYRGVTGGDEKALFKDAAAAKGLSASEILDRFREGPLYYGTGLYGNGIYTAERREKALSYAGGNEDGVVRVVISPDAKVIDDETLHDEYVAWLNTLPKFSPMATVFSDPNRYGAMRGYDVVAIDAPTGGRFNVILNRSALMIEKPNSPQSNDQLIDTVAPTPPLTSVVTTPVAEVTTPAAPTPVSATTKALITPTKAVYAKGIANDDIIAESATGDRRIRWSEGRKRFVDETRGVNGEWSETEALNKSAMYAKLKSQPNAWYTPDTAQAQTDDVAVNDPVDLRAVSPPAGDTADEDIDVPAVVTPGTDTAQRISDINSEIAGILAMNRNNLDEYKRLSDKAKKGKALNSAELAAFNGSLFAVAQGVNTQVRELVNEKLDIIAKSDDSPFDSVVQPNASRWEIPRKPSAAIAGGITADMKKTRDEYVMDDVKTLKNNASLRSTSPSAAAKSWRDRVDSWVNSSTVTNDATVYRGSALTPEQIMNIRPGMIMSDPGIMSTDEDLENANFYADRRLEFTPGTLKTMFTINVPKGANGANASYGEYVFGSNTPLRIIATERVGNDVHVRAEIMSSDDDNVSTPTLADVPTLTPTPTSTSTDSSLSASSGAYTGPSLQISSAITPGIIDEYMALETRRLATNQGYGNGDLTDDEVKRLWALSDEIRENGDTATLANLEQRAIINNPFSEWRKVVGLENTSEDDVKMQVAARMREVLADKKIGIRVTHNTLQNIINDGRIKTQFETNTSSGANAPVYRAGYEAAWFGIGQGLDPAKAALVDKEKRPIYGYVMTDGVRSIGRNIDTESVSATTDILNHYGDVQIVLRDDVRDRTTITVGDSLDGRNRMMPSPMNNPEWYSFGPSSGLSWEPPTSPDSDLTESRLRHNSYVEAQIHNGVSTDDIDEVIFPKKPSSDVISQLDSRGISWRVLRDDDVDDLTLDQRNAARKRILDDIVMYNRKITQLDELLTDNPKNMMYPSDRKKITNEITRLQSILTKLGINDNTELGD